MKKIVTFILLFFMAFGIFTISAKNVDLVLSNGKTVYYSGTQIAVEIPEEYKMQDTYFRGAWVTPLAGSIPSYKSNSQYKQEILEMFDVLEYYNINALIFHVRIMNDALYPSKLNPASSYMNTSEDMLSWVIEECHNRGIEFHAWMNPYRVQASGSKDLSKITQKYKNFPSNPASSADNLLMNASGGVILNPCLESVRQFIVDTVMEVMENYDIDAIHFDDYFYISDVDDDSYYQTLNPDGLGKSDWRREQVNLFIKKLSEEMRAFNKKNNRYVQLGISPTGIYNNGDGVVTYDENGNAISSGSKTNGQNHYESYLYSDTLKWINMEWIDYICPQSYWAFSHPIAGYADVMSWWNKVVKYKKVNLYSGMGIYMSEKEGYNYSWGFDSNEAVNQILYASTLENVDGTAFYSYNYLEYTYKGERNTLYGKGLTKIKEEIFTNPAILPQIKSMSCEATKLDKINLVEKTDNSIKFSFDSVPNAKFYVIYRSAGELTYKPEEVYKIIGGSGNVITFTDTYDEKAEYNYSVRVMAKDNSLSDPTDLLTIKYNVVFKDENGNVLKSQEVGHGSSVTAPEAPVISGREFVGWSRDLSNITKDLVIYPKYNDSLYNVTFYDHEGNVLKVDSVKLHGSATAPICEREGFVFDKWDTDFSDVVYDLDVYPEYKTKYCNVKFVDHEGNELLSYTIAYGKEGYFPTAPEREDYNFMGWSDDLKKVVDDIIVTPIYEIQKVKIILINGIDETVIDQFEIDKNSDVVLPNPPEIYGYKFVKWQGSTTKVKYDTKIKAIYNEICYMLKFVDINGNVIEEREFYWFEDPEYPTLPEVEGYKFIGWDTDLSKLPSDKEELTISPIYEKEEISIKFIVDDEVILDKKITSKEELEKEFVYPTAPEKEGYEFIGWDKEVENKWEDQTITALYKIKTFKVTIIDKDGNVIKELTVEYGKDVDLNIDIPEVIDYEFKGFSSDGKNITADTTITLEYVKKAKEGCKLFSVINLLTTLSFVFVALKIFKKH